MNTPRMMPVKKSARELFAEMNRIQQGIADMEREKRVRNRERDFAQAAGWTGEAYWVTAPLAELEAEQRKFASEYE